ncbi:FecCD family ABC transporter permease [Nocardia huaxiensis]|uniref:Iron chelate uptake ABC transporter family permease subunit n=1 Tax=Nocardia huaxiensis TaxID=2755382 RepID=A0A7D6ZK91_9NOCA|nr:iron chelate uptake ABC transporter family permease subunit [Nocardia huaxiensis]QLY33179.1 iron chelate uptake ABC transporter family permease subunit [Nocardia huaxiensis]UFS93051.1 iron chelate uptake ABC transporter family permease subunit [Nocardia huaxiensis]
MTGIDFGRSVLVLRSRRLTARVGIRTVVVCAVLVTAALIMAVLSLGTGDYPIPPDRVVRALFVGDQRFDRLVVWDWRFPRVALALALGAALGVSGAILQSVTRNPLGSPDLVGFNTGAYTGALIVILALGGGGYQTAAGALIGGLLAALAIQLLAFRHNVTGFRLIIVGIGVSAMLSSVNTWLILRADLNAAMSAAAWGAGSLSGVTWPQVAPALVLLAGLGVAAVPASRRLQILELGDDLAQAFGIRVGRDRMLLIVLSVALTAVATAVAGPIAFLALAAPQLGRRLARTPSTALAPAAAMGALLLVTCDWISQRVFAPTTLPVGVVTVSVGGLYLAYLLVAEARRN